MDDHELLRNYADCLSQDAFRALVDRHLGMVYSAARRMVRDAHLAEEVAQSVFTTLAQKSGSIGRQQIVGGWLYNTTRNLAMHAVRTEQRRREREQTAAAMQSLDAQPDPIAGRITEQLEPAMAELESDDRDALVLRYLENRTLREVGHELGISEDAARMRVNRALERLRTVFSRQGIAVTSIVLAGVISAGTASAVPAGLGASITAAALAGATVTTAALTHATITTMSWINAKAAVAILGAALVAGTGTYLVQQGQINQLRSDNQALAAAGAKLAAEHDDAVKAVQARSDELERLRKDVADLPRLRGEVTQLRRETQAAKLSAGQTVPQKATARAATAFSPGAYVTKDQLAFVGWATPEAAMQSMAWGMMNTNYDVAVSALSPEEREKVTNDPKDREGFNQAAQKGAQKFKGMQILAKKTLADGKVELKVKMDEELDAGESQKTPSIMIQPMSLYGSEWKLGGSTRPYNEAWDQDGLAQSVPQ